MDDGFWSIITDPYVLGVCTIVGTIAGVLGLRSLANHTTYKHTEIEKIVEKPIPQKKPDHIKTLATTATILPPTYMVGKALSEGIKVQVAKTTDVPPEIISEATALAGGMAAASSSIGDISADSETNETIADTIISISEKGI